MKRKEEILGNVFEILLDFWLNIYVMGLHSVSNLIDGVIKSMQSLIFIRINKQNGL